ncbi:MAG TPA: hypothetical protein VFG19_12305 [Geobacteraceae bacterium]|nr:hypothetical protein [Geobacteraceae bacterium]
MNQKLPFRFIMKTPIIAILAFILILPTVTRADFPLPVEIRDKVEVISTFDSKQVATPVEKAGYAEQQHVYTDLIGNALKPAGKGGVYEGKVLKVKKVLPIFRVYTKKTNPQTGRNNRFGSWWTFVPPGRGITKTDYRKGYEICESFNPDLDRVAQCSIYPGALLLMGPGQSVDSNTCGNPDESYPADIGKNDLQIFIYQMYNHAFQTPDQHEGDVNYIGCPPETDDRSFEWYSDGKAGLY